MSDFKGLFEPYDAYDALCTLAVLVGSMIAAGGGLGGGGVFVPIYILILSFSTKHAAALSQATILGGSLVNLVMNWRAFHPIRKHRPLTDFGTLLVFEPMLLVGTVIGVLLNVVLPAMLILILLIVTLLYATFRTTRKGYIMWQHESSALDKTRAFACTAVASDDVVAGEGEGEGGGEGESDVVAKSMNGDDDLDGSDGDAMDADKEKLIKNSTHDGYGAVVQHDRMHEEDELDTATVYSTEYDPLLWTDMASMCGVAVSQLDRKKVELLYPLMEREKMKWMPMAWIGLVWLISSFTSIGKSNQITGVESCSALYWVITFLSFPVLLAISLFYTKQQYDLYEAKEQSGAWLAAQGDIRWNQSMLNMVKYPLIATIAGLLGGLLGIGGGMIVSPLLMELGVQPTVAAATSAMCVLITSSSATLQFVLLDYLSLDYTFYFMGVGIVGTFIGQTVVNYCIAQYGRKSLIVFSVAAIMGGAVLLMGIDGVLQLLDGISWAFTLPC